MARNWVDTELMNLMGQEFQDNLAALIELQRFRMFATANGYRGSTTNLMVKNRRIIYNNLEEDPREVFPFRKTHYADIPKGQVVEKIHKTVDSASNSQTVKKAAEQQADTIKAIEESKEPELKLLRRSGGPRLRALKREEKKGKAPKRKSRNSKGYRR